jgi:hypothetical protein
MAKFRNVTAPNIQQQYIAYGQQRGTGLDDTLTRAGVDLDQLLNQEMMKYQEQAQNRKAGTINQILGMSSGAQQNPSDAQNAATGVGNYISGQGFSDSVAELFRKYQQGNNASTNNNNAYRSPSGMTQGAAKGYWAS